MTDQVQGKRPRAESGVAQASDMAKRHKTGQGGTWNSNNEAQQQGQGSVTPTGAAQYLTPPILETSNIESIQLSPLAASNSGGTSQTHLGFPPLLATRSDGSDAVRRRMTDDAFLADPEAFKDNLLLPVLSNMATALLDFVVRSSPQQLVDISERPKCVHRKAWDGLCVPFRSTRERFRTGSRYVEMRSMSSLASLPEGQGAEEVTKTINVASAVAEVLVPTYEGMVDLQLRLPSIFQPFAKFVQADRMELIGGLLTQVHVARLKMSMTRRELAQEDPFAQDLERRLSNALLGDGDHGLRNEFWLKCRTLRQQLLNSSLAELVISDGRLRFLRSLRRYIGENVRHGVVRDFGGEGEGALYSPEGVGQTSDVPLASLDAAVSDDRQANDADQEEDEEAPFNMEDMIRNAAREAHAQMNHGKRDQNGGGGGGGSGGASDRQGEQSASSLDGSDAPPVTSQTRRVIPGLRAAPAASTPRTESVERVDTIRVDASTPTADLYKKARLEDVVTEREKQDRANATSGQRKHWSEAEELALMQGLDKVQGPHWARILAMFGSNGSVSEVLKERSQVQLKDKARNLKLYFLKRGDVVPRGLQLVTGELKTRAPGRVVKNEMQAQLQRSASEDKATSEAISVLTGARPSIGSDDHDRDGAGLSGGGGGGDSEEAGHRERSRSMSEVEGMHSAPASAVADAADAAAAAASSSATPTAAAAAVAVAAAAGGERLEVAPADSGDA